MKNGKHQNGNGHTDDLDAACDSALLSCMPPSRRRLIDALLTQGHTARQIVAAFDQAIAEQLGRLRGKPLLLLQVEAYLEQRGGKAGTQS